MWGSGAGKQNPSMLVAGEPGEGETRVGVGRWVGGRVENDYNVHLMLVSISWYHLQLSQNRGDQSRCFSAHVFFRPSVFQGPDL